MESTARSPSRTSSSSIITEHPPQRLTSIRTQPLSRTQSSRSGAALRKEITHFRMVTHQGALTPAILSHHYSGSGTEEDPFAVEWLPHDPGNPQNWTQTRKWLLTTIVAVATLSVAFSSSAYSGSIADEMRELNCSPEVAVLGTSLFVLGFAVGPMLWAPLSEVAGRQVLFIMSFGFLTLWSGAAAGANGIATLIVFRFLAGLFGSSPLTNSGGVIADMFDSRQRALALSLFAAAPFLGPVIGPIVGGYVGQTIGWRWNEGVMCMFAGVMWIIGCLTLPETYAPILLRRRAERLCKATNSVYRTKMEIDEGKVSLRKEFSTALKRPWMLLFLEPIVLLLTIYLAILYGILYLNFSVYPVVYQKGYGFSPGEGGLAFIGIAIGMIGAVIYNIFENKRYIRISDAYTAKVELTPPEVRLFPAMVGAICLPIGLWWFAWTAQPSISPYVSIAAGIPFGGGLILVFISVFNYLIDSYTLYAASVLAANSILRSLFGCVFPLFASYMYQNLGVQRASSILAGLATGCAVLPILFWKFGPAIRSRCRFAKEAARVMLLMKENENENSEGGDKDEKPKRPSIESEKRRDSQEKSEDIEAQR